MPKSADYNFDQQTVDDSIAVVTSQHESSVQEATNIRGASKPLIDGGWIGEAARAFFQTNEEFLKLADKLNQDINFLNDQLKKSLANTQDTIQQIDSVTAR